MTLQVTKVEKFQAQRKEKKKRRLNKKYKKDPI